MIQDSRHTNRLIHESSPYLLQHAHNPVDWYPWSDEAFNRARDENKLLFVSIGYSSCHWCHVMAHESFEDESVALFLNKHYIPVKVDREERPDIDAVYMEAVQMMTGQGGWPLNVWLTPEGLPLYGGTYFPPHDAFNRPGFLTVLERIDDVYRHDPTAVEKQTKQIKEALKNDLYQHIEGAESLEKGVLENAYKVYAGHYDSASGGFSTAPKFPMAMGLEYLLNYYAISGEKPAADMALHSLQEMIKGGIFDQLGGGFHRYSTDAYWLVPHFEKMLYDNGLLLSVLADACRLSDNPLFPYALKKTIGFLEREMRDPGGGFYSAIDADSEDEEGKFYVWSYDELVDILSEQDIAALKRVYDIRPDGNWESKIILRLMGEAPTLLNEKETSQSCRKLLEERNKRVRPATDDKIILSWNAITVKGLCKAYLVTGDKDWKNLAVNTGNFLIENMMDGKRLYRIWKAGKRKQSAFLDDYALFADALTYLFEITGDEKYLNNAVSLCETIVRSYYDADYSAFFYADKKQPYIPGLIRDTFDNAVPSATSAAIMALQHVGHLTSNEQFNEIARSCLKKLAPTAARHATAFGYFLQCVCRSLQPDSEIVIVGKEDEREPFRKIWATGYRPFSTLIMGDDFEISNIQALMGKTTVNGKATAYVCENFACQEPCTSAEPFTKLIGSGSVE